MGNYCVMGRVSLQDNKKFLTIDDGSQHCECT